MTADRDIVIALRDVRRSFHARGRARVLALVLPLFEVRRGEGVVITGANGSGKTTLIHLIAGLLRPDAGTVRVLGQELGRLDEDALDAFRARHLGCLLQDTPLLDFATAEENIAAARLFQRSPVTGAPSIPALLERFGLGHRRRHTPLALSGGERQRLALAVALSNDPAILLADEPLSGLDPDGRASVTAALLDECVTRGKTVLVVSHHRDELPGAFRTVRLEAPGAFPDRETGAAS